MKFLIVDTYYPAFLGDFYSNHKEVRNLSYAKQKRLLLDQKFGTSDFYSTNLQKVGQEADDLIVNDLSLQFKWAKEHKVKVSESSLLATIKGLPLAYRILGQPEWTQEIMLAQIKEYKPDILYVHNLSIINPEYFNRIRQHCKLIVGQIACPLPPKGYWQNYDLILTSFPHFVPRLRHEGVKSEYLKIAFEPTILYHVPKKERIYDTTFIGSYSYHHKKGTHILEEVANHLPIDFWGIKPMLMSPLSPISRHYHGSAWGLAMYSILAQSKIVINRHIGTSENYANNMRLYESTGMGALLITDSKKNLSDLFGIGKEVVEYKSTDDLVKKIRYYLKNNEEREVIAKAGQKRTIIEHTYLNRTKQLLQILEKHV
ncbi:MAG: glycosyltransferase [Patescibacteria group bacterium]|jgi:hypothetical protein